MHKTDNLVLELFDLRQLKDYLTSKDEVLGVILSVIPNSRVYNIKFNIDGYQSGIFSIYYYKSGEYNWKNTQHWRSFTKMRNQLFDISRRFNLDAEFIDNVTPTKIYDSLIKSHIGTWEVEE